MWLSANGISKPGEGIMAYQHKNAFNYNHGYGHRYARAGSREAVSAEAGEGVDLSLRHARARPGHPRLTGRHSKDVDGRDKPGHDGK